MGRGSKPPEEAEGGNPRFVLYPDESYDFMAHRHVERPTNVYESVAHLVKGCLGGGIMGVHVAYSKAGLWAALISNVIAGCFITYCVHLLVRSAQKLYVRLHVTNLSFPDVAEAALQVGPFIKCRKYSKTFRYIVDTVICIDLFGSCAVYEIMIARTIVQLIKYAKGEPILNKDGTAIDEPISEVRLYVACILIPILLLCMITSLKYLAPFSIIANIFILMTVATTIYHCFASKTKQALLSMPAFGTLAGYAEFAGIVVFSTSGVGVSLPIENNMRWPKRFPITLCAGMAIVVTFVCCVGFFGYWGFGNSCKAPVTLNFPADAYNTVLKGLMALMIYVTFALNFWAPFNLCWYYIAKKYDPSKHWLWERVYRAICVIIITACAIAFPSITSLMGVLGGFCLGNMAFIFPAIIDTLVTFEKPGPGAAYWRVIKNIIIMIIGAMLFTISGYFNAKELVTAGS